MNSKRLTYLFIFVLNAFLGPQCTHAQFVNLVEYDEIITGAQQTPLYLTFLEGKNVGVVTNQTGLIGKVHLVDTMIASGVNIIKVFTPEHGFRGDHDAGALVLSTKDEKTGLTIISLYGKKKKPEKSDLDNIEIMVFDLQDVGVRFYTYISTLTYVMEACAENNIPFIVLDRPNPNGYYIDGPVLDPAYKSFVGLHPVPIVYGLTIGEYARMVNGESWLSNGNKCQLTVIPLKNYDRNTIFKLPVKPSPNLPTWESVYLYPSLCFFEGTIVSVGRGTDFPFQAFGHPDLLSGNFTFVPKPIKGVSSNPVQENKLCNGFLLKDYAWEFQNHPKKLNINWLIDAYHQLSGKSSFFNQYFNTLAGTDQLRKQIEDGMTAEKIAESWKNELDTYKNIRVKYLIYPDFK
ncbi:MAG: DUF1343 domain-containing protein [Bacteroidetes bacterium HGW-Bacteroidetes-1]|jgi:uncharacterized protein YbbC (DUF1343 family)|nr:MAG: DUF1343 domain-containing protein [Bacteroidetes bacterium HGW-Bacteroidetes-1]